MGRFGSAGRGGRAGSTIFRRPKYLSITPKSPKSHTPLTTPELTTSSSNDEEVSFESFEPSLDEITSLFSTNEIHDDNDKDNGWITQKNVSPSSLPKR